MSLATPARPDLEVFAEATRADQPALVRGLRDLLGARLVAYLAGPATGRPSKFCWPPTATRSAFNTPYA